jgi:gluconolactonase
VTQTQQESSSITRRTLVKTAAALAGAAALVPGMGLRSSRVARASDLADPPAPPSVISDPPREWGPDAPPEIYPDPDIIVVDPAFGKYLLGITAIHRLWTGARWAEGPAWSSQGHYLVFSDVQANIQYRYIWESGLVSKFRDPSFNSNGNAFDFQGRQISTEVFNRRVVRWEHDGTMTVIADSFQGKPLNSPNDLVPHPDGSIWFTDPPYGDTLSEGHPDVPGGPANPGGKQNPNTGAPNAGGQQRQLGTNVYRWDPSGSLSVVIGDDQLPDPNGLCFSPDYKTLYVASTGAGPGDQRPGGQGVIFQFDVSGSEVGNQRLFTDLMVDGIHCGPDGMRADIDGNLWCSSNAPLGYAGVLVYTPQGQLIGRIRLPEVCANVTFGGPKRNFLLICASQSIYALQVQTQGAAPG